MTRIYVQKTIYVSFIQLYNNNSNKIIFVFVLSLFYTSMLHYINKIELYKG
jgi:hypothetical protein